MPTVSEVCSFLDRLAPPELSEAWDNTGLLIGRQRAEIRSLMTCLTLTQEVADEAVTQKVQMIVTHHPILFRGTKQICDQTTEGRILLTLIESGIAVFSAHTRFDSAAGGINQQLAESFGLHEIQPLVPSISEPGVGNGRMGILRSPQILANFLETIASAIGANGMEFCGDPDQRVRKVAVCCGAADGFLAEAGQRECDVFVTGEARFHVAVDARARGMALVLAGHYYSERPAMELLAATLSSEFSKLRIFASESESNPLRMYRIGETL